MFLTEYAVPVKYTTSRPLLTISDFSKTFNKEHHTCKLNVYTVWMISAIGNITSALPCF